MDAFEHHLLRCEGYSITILPSPLLASHILIGAPHSHGALRFQRQGIEPIRVTGSSQQVPCGCCRCAVRHLDHLSQSTRSTRERCVSSCAGVERMMRHSAAGPQTSYCQYEIVDTRAPGLDRPPQRGPRTRSISHAANQNWRSPVGGTADAVVGKMKRLGGCGLMSGWERHDYCSKTGATCYAGPGRSRCHGGDGGDGRIGGGDGSDSHGGCGGCMCCQTKVDSTCLQTAMAASMRASFIVVSPSMRTPRR